MRAQKTVGGLNGWEESKDFNYKTFDVLYFYRNPAQQEFHTRNPVVRSVSETHDRLLHPKVEVSNFLYFYIQKNCIFIYTCILYIFILYILFCDFLYFYMYLYF